MSNIKMGYLAEFKYKNGFFEDYGKLQEVLCSREALAELLIKHSCIHVVSARSVNVAEYQANHDNKLPELGFEPKADSVKKFIESIEPES